METTSHSYLESYLSTSQSILLKSIKVTLVQLLWLSGKVPPNWIGTPNTSLFTSVDFVPLLHQKDGVLHHTSFPTPTQTLSVFYLKWDPLYSNVVNLVV